MSAGRIEDHVTMHQAEYGGAITGNSEGNFRCGECGAAMAAFVSDADELRVRKLKGRRLLFRTRLPRQSNNMPPVAEKYGKYSHAANLRISRSLYGNTWMDRKSAAFKPKQCSAIECSIGS
jgi:hypothetical protein